MQHYQGVPPSGSGYSAEPEPSCTVSAVPVSIPNAEELADLCERMPGTDRELDVLIAVSIDWRWPDWEEGESTARGQAEKHGIDWLIGRVEHGMASMWRHMPRYTASVDDAISLVPADALWAWDIDAIACVYLCGESGPQVGHHEQPALAICAAALRARAASGTLTEGGDVEQAPGESLSGATAESGDAQPTPVSDPISNKGER